MIKELIDRIVETEAEADALIADALAAAKEMSLSADEESERIIEEAKATVKNDRKKVIESAEKDAEKRFAEIMELGVKEAQKLKDTVKTDTQTDILVEKYKERYGCR